MCAIMPQRIAETDPFKQFTEVVGSGPFRFKADERVQGSLFVYERFDKYKPREDGEVSFTAGPKIVHFDRVEWHVLAGCRHQGRGATGRRDGLVGEPARRSAAAAATAQHRDTGHRSTPATPCLLRPNHLYPPFDKPAVRRALMGAIDQTGVHDRDDGRGHLALVGSMWLLSAVSPLASDAGMDALTGKRDYAAVKKALEVAGYQGEKVVLMVTTDQPIN